MSENDMIAEYIKERMPELLTTCDFALYRLGVRLQEMASVVVETAMQLDWDAVGEKLNEEQQGSYSEIQNNSWKQQTMSRFERVE